MIAILARAGRKHVLDPRQCVYLASIGWHPFSSQVNPRDRPVNPYSSGASEVIQPPNAFDHEKFRKKTFKERMFVSGYPQIDTAFKPSPGSSMTQTMAFGYSLFYKNEFISSELLEKSIRRLAQELPQVSGRIKPSKRIPGLRSLGETEVTLNDAGIEFVIAESQEQRIDDLGHHTWTSGMDAKTLSAFGVPFYTEPVNMDAMLQGKEALLKVKLMLCKDGSVVSLMVSHILADAGRAVKLAERLAQLYRCEATGEEPPPPLKFKPELETPQGFAAALIEDLGKVDPPESDHELSFRQWMAAPYRLHKHTTTKFDMQMVHLPQSSVTRLKKLASGDGNTCISTADALQSFLITLKSSLRGLPLVPTAPREMTINVDLLHKDMKFKDPAAIAQHLGNAAHILHVTGYKQGTDIPSCNFEHDPDSKISAALTAALHMNARLIRQAVSSFRSDVRNVIKALHRQAVLVSLPELEMGAAFVVKGADLKAASTTDVSAFPFDNIDFGSGPPAFTQINYQPRFDWWSIIQAAQAPGGGFMCSVVMEHGLQTKLVTHPIWRLLVPEARLIVADGKEEEDRKWMEQHYMKCSEQALQFEGYTDMLYLLEMKVDSINRKFDGINQAKPRTNTGASTFDGINEAKPTHSITTTNTGASTFWSSLLSNKNELKRR